VKQLIKETGKDNVVGIARTPENAKHLGVEIRKGDYNNRPDFDKALQGVDTVLLVSGMDEPQKRIQQHSNVIEAALISAASGCKKGKNCSEILT
jgi:NAD(P)H dehydrogenase (quinone)